MREHGGFGGTERIVLPDIKHNTCNTIDVNDSQEDSPYKNHYNDMSP